MYKIHFYLFLVFFSPLTGQNITLKGKVVHAITELPVPGAFINLSSDQSALTDQSGHFQIKEVEVGRYSIMCSANNYRDFLITDYLIGSGVEPNIIIRLQPLGYTSDTIFIRDHRIVQTLENNYSITVEETDRFPATFFDPARLIATFPGVISVNDQANHIMIRGSSPNYFGWRLEGLEIVNPNHTNNAGTASDKPSLNGGGVNMISAQLLEKSDYYNGLLPGDAGNALSGVLDMQLRKGNSEKHAFTGQVGILGLDAAIEGPLSKNGASYVTNYRYSTIGLLSSLGVNLGDEEIRFQDLSAHVYLPSGKGHIKLFGIWGKSSNLFEAKPAEEQEIFKDLFNIDYRNQAYVLGSRYTTPVGNKSIFKSGLAWSSLEASRTSEWEDPGSEDSIFDDDLVNQSKWSWNTQFATILESGLTFKTGINFTQHRFEWKSYIDNDNVKNDQGTYIAPYATFLTRLGEKAGAELGIYGSYFSLNDGFSLEPRISISYPIQPKHRIYFYTGYQSQLFHPLIYRVQESKLPLQKTIHSGLSYQYIPSSSLYFKGEFYIQNYLDLILDNHSGQVSFNWFDDVLLEPLDPTATKARAFGTELSIQKFINNQWYFLVSTSWFKSEFQDQNESWQPSRFDNRFIFNGTIGKEITWSKENKNYILGLNLHGVTGGGLREPAIDVGESREIMKTVFDYSTGFSNQLDHFLKINFRIYYRINKAKRSSLLALDIQNLNNQKNASFHYFDPFLDQVNLNYQLGILPIISYKIFL